MRRPPVPERDLSYSAVGATQRADLLLRPPAGFRPMVRRASIGVGPARWEFARREILRLGIQRRSGLRPARIPADAADSPVRAGDSAVLRLAAFRIPVRVVAVIDEPDRCGFVYGTLPGHPECGEESFVVERSPRGDVDLEIRAFSRPAALVYRLGSPLLRLLQEVFTRRYLRALAGPIPD